MQMILEFVKENKKKLLLVLLLVIVMAIISFYISNQKDTKVYLSDSYVYTKQSNTNDDNFVSELPYINIKGQEISEINNDLIKKYYEIININKQFMKYDYYKNGNILSLIIKTYYNSSPNSYPSEVLIYNIDIKSGEVIDNDELLDLFNVSSEDVSEIIRSELKEYYNYEIAKGYITSECDFECYLVGSSGLPILNDCSYYVKDGYLFAYKLISLNSNFFYDTSSGFNLFNFRIKEI